MKKLALNLALWIIKKQGYKLSGPVVINGDNARVEGCLIIGAHTGIAMKCHSGGQVIGNRVDNCKIGISVNDEELCPPSIGSAEE